MDMSIWAETIDIFGSIVTLAGFVMIVIGLIQLFTSYGSQNSDNKNHSGIMLAAGIGICLVGFKLIPMLATQISI